MGLTNFSGFGFLDGIAQPLVDGLGTPVPGQSVLDPGIILTGENGDKTPRPTWAQGGSFLVFRQLQQLIPEFRELLLDNPTNGSSELTGARMVGRWQSVGFIFTVKVNVFGLTQSEGRSH
jgi:deferrochelatase/peroxidase EfeB